MNRIRQWLVRWLQGPAKSAAPRDGQLRVDHPERWSTTPTFIDRDGHLTAHTRKDQQ